MHRPPARRLPLPYLQIINPLEGFIGTEDQARNKPADMFKPFHTTEDLSKAFHPLGQDLRHSNNRQHGFTLLYSISSPLLSSSIHSFFPITFQVVLLYDGQGFWLCTKRLSQGRFQWWLRAETAAWRLSARELHILLWNGRPDAARMAEDWHRVA